MNHFLTIFGFLFLSLICRHAKAQNYEIISPDKNISVSVKAGNSLSYSVKYKDKLLIYPSSISLSIEPDLIIGKESVVSETLTQFVNNIIIPVVKEKRSIIPDVYNELIIKFSCRFELHFRVYDDGVAYRFVMANDSEITVIDEEASFNFQPGTIAYYPQVSKRDDADIFHTSFEEPYNKVTLDSLKGDVLAFSPVLLQPEGLPKVIITESDIDDYPGMFLVKGTGSGLKGKYSPYPHEEIVSGSEFKQKLVVKRASLIAKTRGPRTFPWRIIAIAPADADLLINDLVYRLAPDAGFYRFHMD